MYFLLTVDFHHVPQLFIQKNSSFVISAFLTDVLLWFRFICWASAILTDVLLGFMFICKASARTFTTKLARLM